MTRMATYFNKISLALAIINSLIKRQIFSIIMKRNKKFPGNSWLFTVPCMNTFYFKLNVPTVLALMVGRHGWLFGGLSILLFIKTWSIL